jgi:hypothetical protein
MIKLMRASSAVIVLMVAVGVAGCGNRSETGSSSEPAATTEAVRVTEVDLGRAIGADKKITDATKDFKPNDTIYASVQTSGAAASATLGTRWTYQDGQVVDESQHTIAPQGDEVTEFHISKPDVMPPGKYKLEVMLNGVTAQTVEFEVDA